MRQAWLPLTFMVLLTPSGCGGKTPEAQEPEPQPHAKPNTPPDGAPAKSEPVTPPEPVKPPEPPKPAGPPVTFELKNDGARDLTFTITKGWQPVLFAYTGKPPKAKSVMLFETACTTACDVPDGDKCPVCAEPKNKKEEEAMAKREVVAVGSSVKVPWDGKVFVYEPTKKAGGGKGCKCWKKVDAPPDTYTVKACGLFAAKHAGAGSKPVCVEGTMTLPFAEPAATVTLSFTTPAK